jgi:copper(I)-binding protein
LKMSAKKGLAMPRRTLIVGCLALGTCLTLGLAACSSKRDSGAAASGAAASGAVASGTDAGATPALAIGDAVVQLPAVPGRPAAAYFVLTPGPGAKGALTAVTVDHFARAAMHKSEMAGGAMTMSPVDRIPLIAGKPVVFAPGGLHVMLFDSDGTLKPGGTTTITATFDDGSTINARAKVTAQGSEDMGGMKM